MQLEDHLDDLCVRFIVNIPAEELQSPERICFMIEEAQWFYEDFIRPQDPSLPSLSLKPFFSRIIQRCPILEHWTPEQATRAFEEFLAYKQRVPVRGAILLNPEMNEVVLVKGYKKGGNWTFPRGKINENEDDLDCAMREAYEETGFDIRAAGLVTNRSHVRDIELTMRGQNIRLFIFPGVDKDTPFAPQTRKEIGKIQWYKLSDLPTLKKNKSQQEGTGQHLVINANKFYMVAPFVGPLKRIIKEERKRHHRPTSSHLAAPPIMLEDLPSEDERQYAFHNQQHSYGPLSPPIPSNLPEVAAAVPLDPLASLKSQLNIPLQPSPQHVQHADMDKSNALLALLKQGPATEMRAEPHTPFEQVTFPQRPHSPQRSSHPVTAAINPQSPPPAFDPLHQIQPSGPPASALPQLNPHAQSLLEAFSRPAPQAAPKPARQLSAAKADLLAAFNTKPTSPAPANATANTLLGLLQKGAPSSQTSSRLVMPQSVDSDQQATEAPQQPVMDAASLMRSMTQRPLDAPSQQPPVSTQPDSRQTAPVELSAMPAEPSEAAPSKQNLLALLGKPPAQSAPKPVPSSRERPSAARLNAPINQPHFDAIPQSAVADRTRDQRRAPVAGEKKLYDHRQDDFTGIHQRTKESPKLPKSPKSPRTSRSKHSHASSPKRPGTPKDMAKPFQPQILKRPVTSESNAAFGSAQTLDLPDPSETQRKSSQPGLLDLSSLMASSATANGSQSKPSSSDPPIKAVSDLPRAAPEPLAAVDPQKAELLSLLKSPSLPMPPKPLTVDPDATPKAPFASVPAPAAASTKSTSPAALAETSFPGRFSPNNTAQIISPIVDGELDPLSTRSRVSSLASGTGNTGPHPPARPHLEKRTTTASDKLFLMDYLKNIAQKAS